MKIDPIRIMVILVLLVLLVILIQHRPTPIFDMYVISLRHADRLENIYNQEYTIGQRITIFDAVKGDFVDVSKLLSAGILDSKYTHPTQRQKREIGCYMSHLQLLEQIRNPNGYTIIFEDDFKIVHPRFSERLAELLHTLETNRIDFDMLFLGNLFNNKGTLLIDSVYTLNKDQTFAGTHGYVVNNKHVPKILDTLHIMYDAIDEQYEILAQQDRLTILIVDPPMVNQQNDALASTIEDMSIETFTCSNGV